MDLLFIYFVIGLFFSMILRILFIWFLGRPDSDADLIISLAGIVIILTWPVILLISFGKLIELLVCRLKKILSTGKSSVTKNS